MRLFTLRALGMTAVLAALFSSVLLRQDTTLANSLIDMSLIPPVPFRAVHVTEGNLLAGTLTSRVLPAGEDPYVLVGTVRIPKGVSVRAEPGVAIYAAEAASLTVEGEFSADGVTIVSNHLHPRARIWYGVTARDGGRVDLGHAVISHAVAALTCADGGSLSARESTLAENTVGVVTTNGSLDCQFEQLSISSGEIGFHFIGGTPTITRARTHRVRESVRVFHEAAPRIQDLIVQRPSDVAIRYSASSDLIVQGLTLPEREDLQDAVLDGSDAPTHRWNGKEYPTGVVLIR